MIFDYVDSSLSSLSKSIKILNFSPQFIVRFDRISKYLSKFSYFCGFDPYSPLYLIHDYLIKFVSLEIFFRPISVQLTIESIRSVNDHHFKFYESIGADLNS